MANFFSSDYWSALFFKAMGGQATAVDPNAMAGSFAGSAEFTASLTATYSAEEFEIDGHDGKPRRKAQIVIDMEQLRQKWAQEDRDREEYARRLEAEKAERRKVLAKAMGIEPEANEPEPPRLTIEDKQARLKALTALLDYPKPTLTLTKPSPIDFKARRERKAVLEADRKAREEARALAERIRQEIRDHDDAIILLLLAA